MSAAAGFRSPLALLLEPRGLAALATVDWLTVLAAVVVVVLVLPFLVRSLVASAYRVHKWGQSGPAFRLGRLLLRLPGRRERLAGAWLLAAVAADRGETAEAVAMTWRMLELVDDESFSWHLVTDAANTLVNAGLYREAVLLPRRWPAASRRAGRRERPAEYTIAQINRAEALHNLGRDRQALRLLARIEPEARRHAFAREGLLCLRAWIRAENGETARASAAMAGLRGDVFSRHYGPELHYSRARIELLRGDLDRAASEVELGLAASFRAASRRNGHFLEGEIAIARGDPERAIAHFERGLSCRYRAQGGLSLRRYARYLEELDRRDEAARVWQLIVVRDPQSVAASAAGPRAVPPCGEVSA